ncbi:Spc98 family-domain-containing protein [Sporodiniella umbellata]|nr:Spc98 family-domain-containing protein [Sporodiniella umbellata]
MKSLSSNEPFDLIGSVVEDERSVSLGSQPETFITMDKEEFDLWSTEKEEQPVWNNTLSWDALHSPWPTHSQTQLSKHNIQTPYLTEAPLSFFESVIKTENDVTVVERQLVEGLIQAILGRPSIYFQWNPILHRFQPTRSVRILGVSITSITPIIKEILLFGGRMKTIEFAAKHCQSSPRSYGSVGVAFACSLLELVLNIQNSLIDLLDNMKSEWTLLKLYQYTSSMLTVCQRLCDLCSIQVNEEPSDKKVHPYRFNLPFGAGLLNALYDEIQAFDLVHSGSSAFYRNICITLLSYTSIPYLAILSKWLGLVHGGNGVEEDVYQEFFICKTENPFDAFQEFQIVQNAVLPFFISLDLAVYVLRSGVSLQLLKRAIPHHPLCNLNRDLLLKCRLQKTETTEYIQKINRACKSIQTFNSGKTLFFENRTILTEEQTDTEKEDTTPKAPSLPPWDEKRLLGDFSQSLNLLLAFTNENNNHLIPTASLMSTLNFHTPVQTWCPILNESYMSSFLHHFKLQHHLHLLYDTFLLGKGTFVTGLESILFKSKDIIGLELSKQWPPKAFDMNLALRSVLLEAIEEHSLFSFDILPEKSKSGPNDLGALDFLQLRYSAQYPLNLIITDSIQSKYNRIFTFLVQIFRVSTICKRLFSILKSNSMRFDNSTLNVLNTYRFRFDQFMRSLQAYAHDMVIDGTWSIFMEQVSSLNRETQPESGDYASVVMQPQMLKDYHEHILDRILYQCFLKQSQRRVLGVLMPILQDILNFASLIDRDYQSGNRDQEQLLTQCHSVFNCFQKHVQSFVSLLKILEEKGSGRLGNILHSTNNTFSHMYQKNEARKGLDMFVKELLTRIDLGTFYENKN